MIEGKGYIEFNSNDPVMIANVYQNWNNGRIWYGNANPPGYEVDTQGMRGYRVRITRKPLARRLLASLIQMMRS